MRRRRPLLRYLDILARALPLELKMLMRANVRSWPIAAVRQVMRTLGGCGYGS